jgi:hypothetical protein
MNLERELQLLAAEIAWPPTPDLAARVAAEAEPPRGPAWRGVAWRRHLWRRQLVLAVALLVIALAAAFAVPESRGAILRFLHLGGVTIERVQQLPPAQQRPLGAGTGRVISKADAVQVLGRSLLVPPGRPVPGLHFQSGFVSMVFLHRGEPVLLSELSGGEAGISKKLVVGATTMKFVQIDGSQGIWLAGARHVVDFPRVPPRLAGNVLIWQRDSLTLRLEGRHLTLPDALVVAHSLRSAKM